MSRLKYINLGRAHQNRAADAARSKLVKKWKDGPTGGIILADGVGLGKTYEALATVAMLLAQKQHGRNRKRRQDFRILVLVPPRLYTKWLDELILPTGFRQYLKDWTTDSTDTVRRTFENVQPLKNINTLRSSIGSRIRGRIQLPPGLYLAKTTLLMWDDRQATKLARTPWDAIIVDEAHHLAGSALRWRLPWLLSSRTTATILLTATPFQLSPRELKTLFQATFGGQSADDAEAEAERIYNDDSFVIYRKALSDLFEGRKGNHIAIARQSKGEVEALLKPIMIRNRKVENRLYYLVTETGTPIPVGPDLLRLDENDLVAVLRCSGGIQLTSECEQAYLELREWLASRNGQRRKTFLANALRQLLSTYTQFKMTRIARESPDLHLRGDGEHPKVVALRELTQKIFAEEKGLLPKNGVFRKLLVFTTYVGSEPGELSRGATPENSHGTAAVLKRNLEDVLRRLLPRQRRRRDQIMIRDRLLRVVKQYVPTGDVSRLKSAIQGFAPRPLTLLMLAGQNGAQRLKSECGELRKLLKALAEKDRQIHEREESEVLDPEQQARWQDGRNALFQTILHRYSTRNLVARYDGGIGQQDRDRHLRGFNSPYAPLVLIASSIGQEGIDLQKYCGHIVHYDLEWNPAKLEQREGRVDRLGRISKEPVRVYFLLCRGTYDERIFWVMVNRFRWHHLLLATRSSAKLEKSPDSVKESMAAVNYLRLSLDLTP